MNMIIFILATVLSMPKQFITVYLGVLLEEAGDPEGAPKDNKSKIISNVVLALTVLVTIVSMWYIWKKMREVRLDVLRDMRAARLHKELEGGEGVKMTEYSPSSTSDGHLPLKPPMTKIPNDSMSSLVEADVFNPQASKVSLVAGPGHRNHFGVQAPKPQRWDQNGRAIEAGDVSSYAGQGGYLDPYDYNYGSYPPRPNSRTDLIPGSSSSQPPAPSISPFGPPPGSPPSRQRKLVKSPPLSPPRNSGKLPESLPASSHTDDMLPYSPGHNSREKRRYSASGARSPPTSPTQSKHTRMSPKRTSQSFSQPMGLGPEAGAYAYSPDSKGQIGFAGAHGSPPRSAGPSSNVTSTTLGQRQGLEPLTPQSSDARPGSPFDDTHAIPAVRRQVDDPSSGSSTGIPDDFAPRKGGHAQDATDDTFYTAHSRYPTDVDLR
jgi:hypothetical protein